MSTQNLTPRGMQIQRARYLQEWSSMVFTAYIGCRRQMGLLYFVLCAYGMTYILLYGSIFKSVRPKKNMLGELFACPLCMGFWVGVFLWSINCFTELFTYEYNLINGLLLGSLSAGTSYFLSVILDDFGLKFRNTRGGDSK